MTVSPLTYIKQAVFQIRKKSHFLSAEHFSEAPVQVCSCKRIPWRKTQKDLCFLSFLYSWPGWSGFSRSRADPTLSPRLERILRLV